MAKYECTACGYVYDPAENNNIAFEDLPEDYVCPLCGVGKEAFEKVE
ncbi:MAG: rubredoxin [bacterium]|nr:rubredoxin [bacterium]